MTTDSRFIAAADAALAALGDALDRALEASDADVDWTLNDGILEIECETIAMTSATGQMRSPISPACLRVPLTSSVMAPCAG